MWLYSNCKVLTYSLESNLPRLKTKPEKHRHKQSPDQLLVIDALAYVDLKHQLGPIGHIYGYPYSVHTPHIEEILVAGTPHRHPPLC